ncbi:MAG: FN3 domain-containing metallophosphoesterase family protein [Pseudomonadota bacterium]
MKITTRFLKLHIALFGLGLACLAYAHPGHHEERAPWDSASAWPDRIIVTLPSDPTTSFAVTWRTQASVDETIAEIALATDDTRFDVDAKSVGAMSEAFDRAAVNPGFGKAPGNVGRGPVMYHTARFKGLTPDTVYAYRVRGARGNWSEWFHYRTAPTSGPVKFLYFGDAQRGVLSHWSRMIREGFASAPDADFILHAGDLVNRGSRDTEWSEWFKSGGFIHSTRAVIPVAGNHEYVPTQAGGSKDNLAQLTAHWRPQFALPLEEGLPESLSETVYDVRYTQDLHIFVLDSSAAEWDAQMEWLAKTGAASDAKWKIASFHHSPFRPGIRNKPKHIERREAFLRTAKASGIQMVLAGHNHSYTRASYGEGLLAKTAPNDPRRLEMVVVVAVSGGMTGKQTGDKYERGNAALADRLKVDRWANNTPTFQIIKVDGDTLAFETRTATNRLYDAFTLQRSADGALQVIDGEASFGPIREETDWKRHPGHQDLK